jgi:Holliday junction DNA helicase RuvA
MIGKLAGIVDQVAATSVVIDVGGVGYVVQCGQRTLSRLPAAGGRASLVIETQVREDAINLFGFVDTAEREWFRLLQSVQGVGAKVALAVLGALPPDQLARAVAAQDRTALQRADGVGAKLAQRIVNELKDKIGGIALGPVAVGHAAAAATMAESGASGDAVSALTNLGYDRAEAFGAVARVIKTLGEDASVETLIRAGLKELAR